MIPKNTILKLLSDGLREKSITPDEIRALLPKSERKTGSRKVPKPIRDRAIELTEELALGKDNLRLSAMKGDRSYFLFLFNTENNTVAAKRIGEKFKDIGDMKRAADAVVARYLEALAS